MSLTIYLGMTAKEANGSISDTSDRMINAVVFLIINLYTCGVIAIENGSIKKILICRQERVRGSIYYQCVSRQGASPDTGRDITSDFLLTALSSYAVCSIHKLYSVYHDLSEKSQIGLKVYAHSKCAIWRYILYIWFSDTISLQL